MQKAYIHVYTGNGKGKTTAALGLSIRAVCAGKSVFFGQFVKGMEYSELQADRFLPNFEIEQFGRDSFIYKEATKEDIEAARLGLDKCRRILQEGKHDIVVLDEFNVALYYKLFTVEQAIQVIESRADNVELIITGRNANQAIIDIADLVTEMREIKHYYSQGVEARVGIEK